MANRKRTLAIIVGGDIDSDYDELFSGKPLNEIAQPRNALYLDSFEQLHKLLSPKRLDLLRHIMETQSGVKPKSVSEIATELGRHQEAISRDITSLKNLGLIAIKRFRQTAYALPEYSRIEIKVC